MEKRKHRKTDRRTLYTVNIVKDALLELLEKMTFEKITVSSLCRQAEITRTTFYLHFPDITSVLDEVLNDALQVAENNKLQSDYLSSITKSNNMELLKEYDALLPTCQRIADSSKYRVLFLDETLSNYIIKTIYQFEKHKIIPVLMKNNKLSNDKAEMIFRFMLYGSFAVNKSLGWEKNDKWYAFQQTLVNFVQGGLNNIK